MSSTERASFFLVRSGDSNKVVSDRNCLIRAKVVAPAGAVRLNLYNATPTETLDDQNHALSLFAPASGSDESLQVALGFSTGCVASCAGSGGIATLYLREVS